LARCDVGSQRDLTVNIAVKLVIDAGA